MTFLLSTCQWQFLSSHRRYPLLCKCNSSIVWKIWEGSYFTLYFCIKYWCPWSIVIPLEFSRPGIHLLCLYMLAVLYVLTGSLLSSWSFCIWPSCRHAKITRYSPQHGNRFKLEEALEISSCLFAWRGQSCPFLILDSRTCAVLK